MTEFERPQSIIAVGDVEKASLARSGAATATGTSLSLPDRLRRADKGASQG